MEQNLVVENLSVWRYSEIKDYTFGKEPSMGGPVTGHFTQVIDFMIFRRRALFYHDDDNFDFRWSGKKIIKMIKMIWF